jgi:hypothetical protein
MLTTSPIHYNLTHTMAPQAPKEPPRSDTKADAHTPYDPVEEVEKQCNERPDLLDDWRKEEEMARGSEMAPEKAEPSKGEPAKDK